MIERDVKSAVRALLAQHKWFQWMPPSNAFGRSGIADINAVKYGLFLAIETKVGKNLPSPMQRIYLDNVRKVGGYAFMVNETRLDALKQWLERFDAAVPVDHDKHPWLNDPLTISLMEIPERPRSRK